VIVRTLIRLFLSTCLVLLPAAADDLSDLRERLASQQKQIEELQRTLAAQQKLIEALAQKPAATAVQPAAATQPLKPVELAGDGKPFSPLSFRIGGADFTPGGYANLMGIYRSTNVGSGPGTSFGGIPFENTAAGNLSESRLTAQSSRVTLTVSAKTGKQSVTGYVEADFQGSLPSNAHVSTNANTMRMRLYWLQVRRDKWEILGGQSWSLLTPNRTGLSPRPSDILYTNNLDSNYQVGLTFTRAAQFRLVYHANKRWNAGFALENPQQYIGNATTVPSFYNGQLDNGSLTTAPNTHPDLIAKAAYDNTVAGRKVHFEAAGLFRTFRVFRPAGGKSTARGFGGSVAMNFDLAKNVRFVLSSFHSQGGGRFIYGLGPDVVVGPDGRLSPVHASSGLAGLEIQATPKDSLYAYYGGAYFSRNFSVSAPGQFIGFGFPGSSSSANRSLQEPTFGYTRTFWKNPNYGAIQWMGQYSYVTRSPWSVAAGAPANARTHMVFTNFRFVLP
jgi:hypothetical protein